jgi:hypothetical protein
MTDASKRCFDMKATRAALESPRSRSRETGGGKGSRKSIPGRWIAALLLALCAGPAAAHKASDAYLQLSADEHAVSLRVDVALRDLDAALDLDADGDGRLTWGELRGAWPAIRAYVEPRVQVAGCDFHPAGEHLERRADGVYAALAARADCALRSKPVLRYTLMREIDPTHRGIARIDLAGAATQVRVLDPSAAPPAAPAPRFVREGIRHIVGGYDHVLFLLCLLLPSVMRRTRDGWQPVASLRQAVLPLAAIVTAFTLAHSLTLALAALKLASLPSAFIEPAIAVTIMLAALDNLRPIFRGRRVAVSFAFGLVHGFGFAGVLAELDLPTAQFASALLQFNVGLEFGQLLIVAAATALLFALRHRPRYPAWAIRGGSCAALLVGLLWFVERTTDVSLLPL